MAFGILARMVAIVLDGSPGLVLYLFAIYEVIGVILIFVYTRSTLAK